MNKPTLTQYQLRSLLQALQNCIDDPFVALHFDEATNILELYFEILPEPVNALDKTPS